MKRDQMLDALMALLPSQFDVLVFRLGVSPALVSSSPAPQAIRAVEVLRYLEAQGKLGDLEREILAFTSATPAQPVSRAAPAPAPVKPGRLRCFVSFAANDLRSFEALSRHLNALQRQGTMEFWSPKQIPAGARWADEIERRLADADIVLLLVSASFLGSDETYDLASRAIDRSGAGHLRVVPVLVKPCDWQGSLIGHLQALPRDGKPISTWRDEDEAMNDIVQGLMGVASAVRGAREVR